MEELLKMMQTELDNRNEMVDKTISNINEAANKGNKEAQLLKTVNESTLRKAANEMINKKATA